MTYTRYRHLAIENARPAPSDEQLLAIETLLGTSLPASFRDFLKVANGGYIEYIIDVPDGNGQYEELSFCSIFTADDGVFCDETFVGEIRSGREHMKIPPGVLPFAQDGGGSIVFLDLSTERNGRVVSFVQGLPEWAGLCTEDSFIELATSFDEYISKLRIDRRAVFDHLSHDAMELSHVDAIEEWIQIGIPDWQDDPELLEAVLGARRRLAKESGA